jgi:hypothetical protein
MRTTVRLDDALMREARVHAAERGISFTQLLDESLRARLSARPHRMRVEPFRLTTYGKGGVRPGVNLDDNRATRDLMDEDFPPSPERPADQT